MIICNQYIKVEILCNSFTIRYSWIWAVNFTKHENGNRNEFLLLQGMKDRLSLTGTPELGLKNAITYHDSVDEYGHRVQEALQAVSYQLKKKSCLVSFKKRIMEAWHRVRFLVQWSPKLVMFYLSESTRYLYHHGAKGCISMLVHVYEYAKNIGC